MLAKKTWRIVAIHQIRQSFVLYGTCSILDTTLETKLIAITLEGKMLSSILKDFLTRHVMLIQINNRSHDCNESTMLGLIERDACSGLEKHE